MKFSLIPDLNRSGDTVVAVTGQLLQQLGVKVSGATLKDTILSHPDYPSLLSISDSLERWGIQTLAIKTTPEKLDQLPRPFIAFLKMGRRFVTVRNVTDNEVFYSDQNDYKQSSAREEFLKQWDGVVLLAQANEQSGEVDYSKIQKKEQWQALRIPLVFIILLLAGITQLGWVIAQHFTNSTYYAALLAGHFLGIIISGALLWYEYDQHNPLLQKVCSMGRKTNCGAVLTSKGATVIGNLTWSDIGFIYFTGGYLYLLLTGPVALHLLVPLSFLALPYILFSVYYQARVARRWCVLCLSVQALLLLEAAAAILTRQSLVFPTSNLLHSILYSLLSFILPAFVWLFTKPYIYAAKKGTEFKYQLARFKNNSDVFRAMLQRQPALDPNPDGMGIRLGNPKAPNRLIKVCNPYCGPCAKAHPKIEELINENPDWQVQIVFTATGENKDRRTAPAAHLLAIAEQNNNAQTRQALDDWYNAEEKDYEHFAGKYPMNGEIDLQKKKLKAMDKWCKEVGITGTPTFFVNGYELPAQYELEDLKYL